MSGPGALRIFVVRKSGKPKTPSGVVVTHAAPERLAGAIDSTDVLKMFHETPPRELRERFGYYLNDADQGRISVLYVIAPLKNGKVRLQPVPFKYLRHFFNDIAFDWASFDNVGGVPPNVLGGDVPLFDPRFVVSARAKPTAADREEEAPKPKRASNAKPKRAAKSRRGAQEQKEITIVPAVDGVYPHEKDELLQSDDIAKYKMWCGGESVYDDATEILGSATGMVPGISRCEKLCG